MIRKITKLFEPHGVLIRKSGEKIPTPYTLAYKKDGTIVYVIKDKKKVFKKGEQNQKSKDAKPKQGVKKR